MTLAQFAAEHNISITDRVQLLDKIGDFVKNKNYAYYKQSTFGDPIIRKHMLYGIVPVVLLVFMLTTGIPGFLMETAGWGQLVVLGLCFFGGIHIMIAVNRLKDGVGPYHIELHVVAAYDSLPESFAQLSDDLQGSTRAFFDTFPGGKVYFGTLCKDSTFVQPTSLRFEHENETVNAWTEPDILAA